MEVRVGAQPLERFAGLLGRREVREARRVAARMRRMLAHRVVWNVNSTAVGGGVAEMLPSLLSYTRASGIDTRWLVIEGDPRFFRVTKRLHHALHGSAGDGSRLGDAARRSYESTSRRNAQQLLPLLRPGDFVILHDPQTAGLAPALAAARCHLVWRCHIGHDEPNEESLAGWRFLEPYLRPVDAFVFSSAAYVPAICDRGRSHVITPSIDAFSPKNQDLDAGAVRAILVESGLVAGPIEAGDRPAFEREDGSPSRVARRAMVTRVGKSAPRFATPLVVQVSRWDPLKDPVGVMRGFSELVAHGGAGDVELLLAGPDVRGVSDDPEGAGVLRQAEAAWLALPEDVRPRVHLASLPTEDVEENAAIVNALQRHATIVVQKSLREGFGLTVTEAMWKGRAVVASAVGGIRDQIEHGVSGLLLEDPRDDKLFASLLGTLLRDATLRDRLGAAARERVKEHFLGMRHLIRYAELLQRLD